MTTRLSQKKIKGGDPAYQTLDQQLKAMSVGGAGGTYVIPDGGIPRSHMTTDVQNALQLAEKAYIIPSTGVPMEDLNSNVRSALVASLNAYNKPNDGIPLTDLAPTIQSLLQSYENFYVYPTNGIPYVDLDSNVKSILSKAVTAYQKPNDGIPLGDLENSVVDTLSKATTAYQKPASGIPASDLDIEYVEPNEIVPFKQHINDKSIHITDHNELTNIGELSHEEIDKAIEDQASLIQETRFEIENARDSFSTLGARIDATIGRNSYYIIDTEEEWKQGTLENLQVNKEGNLSFLFQPSQISLNTYDLTVSDSFTPDNKLRSIVPNQELLLNMGAQWVDEYKNNVGVELKAYIYAPVTGTYTFQTQFSGRIKFQVAGQSLVLSNTAYAQIDSYVTSNDIYLVGGRLYPIIFEGRYGTTGARTCSILWKQPNQTFTTPVALQYLNQNGYTADLGIYKTPVIDLRDEQIGVWGVEIDALTYRPDDTIHAEISLSDDGITFGDWIPVSLVDDIHVTPKRFVKIKLIVKKDYVPSSPLIQSLKLRYVSALNNEIRKELIDARNTYLSLQDRLDDLDNKLQQLTTLHNQVQVSGIHPEQFSSLRLLSMELNQLRYYIRESEKAVDYFPLENGVVDTFKTDFMLDEQRSHPYEIIDGSLFQKKTKVSLQSSEEWDRWTLFDLENLNDMLRLATDYLSSTSNAVTFSNLYAWSTTGTAQLGASYQNAITQPFYTGNNTNTLTRLNIQLYGVYNVYPYVTVMICPSNQNGTAPDLSSPIWAINATNSYNFVDLRIPVKPLTKYWIVLKINTVNTGYTVFYVTPNNNNTNARLRTDNPENSLLYYKYSANNGATWYSSNYFLSFQVDEARSYKALGSGYRILDYQKEMLFTDAVIDVTDIDNGYFSVVYQSSVDTINWSEPEPDISKLPKGRFLKITVSMGKSSIGIGSPLLRGIDIYHQDTEAEIITRPIELPYIPTHLIFTSETTDDEAISFQVSRDDGHTWIPIKTNDYTKLDSIQAGRKVRIKFVYNEDKPLTAINNYAFAAMYYRDVTGQNITALYEEYIAEEGQTIFHTKDPFPTGNHALQVYLNGIRQSILEDYNEVDNYTIEFTEPLIGGLDADRITLIVATGAYDVHDSSITARVEDLETIISEEVQSQRKKYTYNELNQLVMTEYLESPVYHTIKYTYREDGRKETEVVTRGSHQKHIEYVYDDEGRISEEVITISEVTD